MALQPALKASSRRKSASKNETQDESARGFVFSLVCPYLVARDLLSLSLASKNVGSRIRQGAAKTLQCHLRGLGDARAFAFLNILTRTFPYAIELILMRGTRVESVSALKGAARLKLTKLSITLADKEDATLEPYLDGRAFAACVAGFPGLERLEIRNIGPMVPQAIAKLCSGYNLRMIRLSRCPVLMDSCLSVIIARLPELEEITIEECPSLKTPTIVSDSLVRLKLSRCFSLLDISLRGCPNLIILDVPWAANLVEPISILDTKNLRYLSFVGATQLEHIRFDGLNKHLNVLDLGACTRLKTLHIGSARGLTSLIIRMCVSLESIDIREVHQMEELDLSLLPKLRMVRLSGDLSLRRLIIYGCDSLQPECVFVSPSCRRIG